MARLAHQPNVVRNARSLLALPVALALLAPAAALAQEARPSASDPAAMQRLAREVAIEFASRAAAAERTGRNHAAESLYLRAVEADPGYLPGYLGLVRVLLARGHRDDAARALAVVPPRAMELDRDAVQVARAYATVGDAERALALLAARIETVEILRAQAEIASNSGRFPEALRAARRLTQVARAPDEVREGTLLARALAILVADADAVRAPGERAPLLRRLLASE